VDFSKALHVMVHLFLLGSTLLKTQRSIHLPRIFYRYKSITAAIERGRQGGPDRLSRPQPRTSYADSGDRPEKTRFERRLERFGPADNAGKKEFTRTRSREDQPRSNGGENVTARRSSRFGRVGPPRPRDDAPSRFREERPSPRDRDDRPQRRENPFGAAPERAVSRGRSFEEEGRPSSDRYSGDRDSATDRAPRRDRFDAQDERPPRRERPSGNRDVRTSDNDRGSRLDKPRSFDVGRSSRANKPRTFDNDRGSIFDKTRTSYLDRNATRDSPTETSGDRGESRTDRPNRVFPKDDASPYTRPPREAYDGRSRESRFPYADSKGARRERSRTGSFERSYTHESSYKQTDSPSGTASDTANSKTTVRDIESLPYTTAASEFIYGHSSVLAAIKAQRRKFYNLYVHPRGASRDNLLARIRALKLFPITKEVGDDYIRAMDKASNGRPHNGVVLESSPLPVPPITELKTTSLKDESFSVTLDTQSAEDALVNGKQENYPYRAAGWRHPLVLYVDGVVSFSAEYYLCHINNCSSMKATLEPSLVQPTSSASMP
jgi:21S rRNA (GM2251-2'-O)-methyltransferase